MFEKLSFLNSFNFLQKNNMEMFYVAPSRDAGLPNVQKVFKAGPHIAANDLIHGHCCMFNLIKLPK